MPDFMRPKHAPMPVEQAPFYAIKMKMFHENSIGGMTIDENASVLKNGIPIPGLYAAGDNTRGIMVSGDIGVDYLEQVFSSLTMAYNEGYIAGTEAAGFCK
jgi:predicted oxidoreductase